MPRRRTWEIDGQVVVSADVRRWMQAQGWTVGARGYWRSVDLYRVPAKIAAAKARGDSEALITDEAARRGVRVRAARSPGSLERLRQRWPAAANDQASSSRARSIACEA